MPELPNVPHFAIGAEAPYKQARAGQRGMVTSQLGLHQWRSSARLELVRPPETPCDHNANMSVTGVLIAESLLKSSPLEGVTLQVRKVSRGDVGDESAGQPLTWTFIEFNVEDRDVSDLVEALSRSLDPAGGWYCDFRTAGETLVVYAGRAFRYPRGDRQGRAEAEAYGRSAGVPEAQLDWPE